MKVVVQPRLGLCTVVDGCAIASARQLKARTAARYIEHSNPGGAVFQVAGKKLLIGFALCNGSVPRPPCEIRSVAPAPRRASKCAAMPSCSLQPAFVDQSGFCRRPRIDRSEVTPEGRRDDPS